MASKTTKKTNTLSRKPNKIKTEVKPKSIVFQVKPSFLFQKFLFSSGIPCLSVEDLTEVTIFKSYCIVQLKTVSLRKKCILSRKTAYLKGKKMQEGAVLKFILLKEILRFLKEVHEGTA